ncbi:MAG: class II fructose-bisphosphate aldolase [Melioribacteraceae bacterium]
MPLVNLNEILNDAKIKNYAVGMFDVVSSESLRAIISGAEECNSPVIIALAEVHLPYVPLQLFAPLMVDTAKNSKVPVAVHLDHGLTFDTIIKVMNYGFSSVMFDGSSLEYEENISGTKEITKVAKALGVSVEAELGHVGGGEAGSDDNFEEYYTDPKLAFEFVDRTGIDALAVAIGTVHGVYVKKPCLDLNRLSEINNKIDIPLVLHGGSGLSDSDFKECINRGIRKINIFTDMSYAAVDGIRKFLIENKKVHCFEVTEIAEKSMREVVINKINLFGSNSKA